MKSFSLCGPPAMHQTKGKESLYSPERGSFHSGREEDEAEVPTSPDESKATFTKIAPRPTRDIHPAQDRR